MATGMSDYLGNLVLDRIFRGTSFTVHPVYVALHTGDPSSSGANEVTGGSYARVAISTNWDAATDGATANSAVVQFTGMPSCTVTHVSLWDAASSGNFLWGGTISSSVVVGSGQSLQFNVSGLTATLNTV